MLIRLNTTKFSKSGDKSLSPVKVLAKSKTMLNEPKAPEVEYDEISTGLKTIRLNNYSNFLVISPLTVRI